MKVLRKTLILQCIVMAGLVFLAGSVVAAPPTSPCEVCDRKCEYTGIQQAIDDQLLVNDCAEIIIHEGRYLEAVNFKGLAITLRSTDPLDPVVVENTEIHLEDTSGNVVTFISGEGSGSVIDGLRISGYESSYGPPGSGIFCRNSSPTIRNSVLSDSHSTVHGGGGMHLDNCSPLIADSTIRDNIVSSHQGGGIYAVNGSAPTIENTLIQGNTGNGGGGIFLSDSSPNITGSTITGNWGGQGGGIYIGTGSSPLIEGTVISGNWGTGGGGLYAYMSTPEIRNSTIELNYALGAMASGGGIYSYFADISVLSTTVKENYSSVYGGGILAFGGAPVYDSSRIFNNYTTDDSGIGGGFYFMDASPTIVNCDIFGNGRDPNTGTLAQYGGGIALRGETAATRIVNTTIAGNSAFYGGGGIYQAFDPDLYSAEIANSILYFNAPTQVAVSTQNPGPVITYSDVEGGWPADPSNIAQDPLFVDISDPDPANWDLHLQSLSPCRDSGDPNSAPPAFPEYDGEGDPRSLAAGGDGLWDMGADEYRDPPGTVVITRALYDYAADTLEVNATSPNNENADLVLVGFGEDRPMTWSTDRWIITISWAPAPGSIMVCGPLDGCSSID